MQFCACCPFWKPRRCQAPSCSGEVAVGSSGGRCESIPGIRSQSIHDHEQAQNLSGSKFSTMSGPQAFQVRVSSMDGCVCHQRCACMMQVSSHTSLSGWIYVRDGNCLRSLMGAIIPSRSFPTTRCCACLPQIKLCTYSGKREPRHLHPDTPTENKLRQKQPCHNHCARNVIFEGLTLSLTVSVSDNHTLRSARNRICDITVLPGQRKSELLTLAIRTIIM